jgi:putative ABC transport system substrate-binding protein
VLPDLFSAVNRDLIIALAARYGVPAIYYNRAFLQGLHELGYTERQNLAIERQYADGSSDQLRELAAELVRRKPDIIVAFSTTAARPAKRATGTIAIVAVGMADPVADELVTSLA